MKKTLTINLNGIVFHIDDDAYQALKQYLADIKTHLASDGDEADDIVADIEARIAELFGDMLLVRKREVVDMDMLQAVMATMGNPGSFGNEEGEPAKPARKRKRFYRDVDNALLGGVAAGIAAYIGWDVVIVRILLLVIAIFGWWGVIPIYCLIWIIAPAAETAAQKLEMRGEEATIENIKNAFTDARNDAEDGTLRGTVHSAGRRVGRILLGIVKVLLILFGVFFGFIALMVIAALFIALLAVLFGFGTAFVGLLPFGIYPNIAGSLPWQGMVALVSLILLAGIPLFTLVYGLIRYIRIKRGPSATYGWTAFAVWMVALVAFVSIGIYQLANHSDDWVFGWAFDNDEADMITEVREAEAFYAVDASGAVSIEMTQDTNTLLTVSAPAALLRNVNTEVRDSVLYINTGKMNSPRQGRVKVSLSTPELRRMEVKGASKIRTEKPLKQNSLTLALYGASKADLQLELDSAFNIDVAGASKLHVSGLAQQAVFDVAGASKVNAEDFCVQDMQVSCAGGSKMDVWCENDLKVRSAGASKVVYKGEPHISERIVSGASSIKAE